MKQVHLYLIWIYFIITYLSLYLTSVSLNIYFVLKFFSIYVKIDKNW